MTEKRYHVYISTAFYGDVKAERLKMEYALLNMGVFPWEFNERRTSLNTAQARRQIDDCDYVIFLLGGKYGDVSASGISYMHLDFLYALNKQKTIISFIDIAPEQRTDLEPETNPESSKKFINFRAQIKKDSQYCIEYNGLLDLERAVRNTFIKAIKETPALGWVRPKDNDLLQNEIQRLRQKITKLEQHNTQTKYEMSTSVVEPAVGSSDEKILVSYRTHAYQDGNLKDIHAQKQMTWVQLLNILASHFKQPALENNFLRILNHYLESTALADAREILPRAHAVARTQIDARSLQQIKLQMKWNNWIVPQHDSDSGSRIYWQLTTEGQRFISQKKA
ncbi:DUF4062 domain-containing protein [Acinetobacter puyangensis]|uniref:DUF4062 domain-containing protein n=1 Tax=Acinetobacter puyangensis TaxID=1096779 RepID=A0A240EBQ7_9GAMM|nr:DUF4062 domain-containing protein [Acinetobacter puyangensis]SNX46112.1 protein of unknown function [Acinetobacter puyangensis]